MIRLVLAALLFMPPASLPAIATPMNDTVESGHHLVLTSDFGESSSEVPDDSDNDAKITPMQEETIADHDSTRSPFLASLWEKHVALPTSPLFPVSLVDLFRPPKRS